MAAVARTPLIGQTMQSIRTFIFAKLSYAEWDLSPACALDLPSPDQLVPLAETASHPDCHVEVV